MQIENMNNEDVNALNRNHLCSFQSSGEMYCVMTP